ncbi:hypothetical protein JHK82_055773 [Glycine max]|nr:hypothetical protein JHK85_056597 [Glycine max]KAG5074402.1 hypothetical protein JHK84_055633 [Glycine max]KAG5077078.1 hypothetical protein JHK82_055773 [Glycine max]
MQKLLNILAISCLSVFLEEPLASDHPKDEHNIINNVKQDEEFEYEAALHVTIYCCIPQRQEQQACGRPLLASRMHVWTLELTQALLGDPEPLKLPPLAAIHLPSCGFHMTILRRFDPPLQWPVVLVCPGFHGKYVAQPWYRFLAEGDFVHGDELSFYYRPRDNIWEIVIRK